MKKIAILAILILLVLPTQAGPIDHEENFTAGGDYPNVWAVWGDNSSGFSITGGNISEMTYVKSQTGVPEVVLCFHKKQSGDVDMIVFTRYRAIRNMMIFDLSKKQVANISRVFNETNMSR
jgi:hypothetical protein